MNRLSEKAIARISELYDTHSWDEITRIINKEFNLKKSSEAIRKAYKRRVSSYDKPNQPSYGKPKILVFDIETAPLEALVWSIWDQNIPLSRIKKDWCVLAWAAKWLGDDPNKTVYYDTFNQKDQRDDKKILEKIWELLDEADYVLGHNSDSFDIKKLNARFIQHGMNPPSSYKKFDTKKLAKKHFAFTSNKLEYITDKLCSKYKKLSHSKFPGNALWDEFLKRNKEAQKEMEIYNKYDVLSLEEAFLKILPWESANLFEQYYDSDIDICTCGSIDFKKNGFFYTQVSKFQRYTCKSCGAEMRSKESISSAIRRNTKR
jgi:hypothetical protein